MDEKINKNNYTMSQMIHKCLRCDKMVYEIYNGIFKCSDDKCGFFNGGIHK